ncbi:DUF4391 domain-containing protein [Pasteurella multocida]|uniref:DUF4391 domain-containing protein n=1 Tax=Pasteurella multocida (strain Pm70) TaxID=272843 RepID=Q9CMV7_PASMU|nr:DUF4391 domain-containing protein [Pasteurella multocida]AAK02781.1 unknown [Pasteurella multocida subsp. multocida str. Pm70]APW55301.1 Methyl-accepting chemotaxis protein [Pasteurella multocida subsp. multocida str. HN07]ARA69148.1 hypothetical protein BTV67_00760 [Pasteurella multocida subsp. multocida]AUL53334.1 hypothetical protein ATO47_03795 [Pasteurella multocida]AWB54715.1 DUF4391 domain-containing protein [Pasteurella multocida]
MALYRYPGTTAVNRQIPKNKFYQMGNATHKLEQLFVNQIERIHWANKLAENTLRIPPTDEVKEIQIFHLHTRVEHLDKRILNYIDNQILSPIIFEIHYQNKIKVIATYKRLSHTDKTKVVLDHYYESAWLTENSRQDLPIVLNLADLYAHLLHALLPFTVQDEINTAQNIEQILQKQREISLLQKALANLTTKLKNEKQFNRKVEINQKIQQLQKQINNL